jgi:hypothetical protein
MLQNSVKPTRLVAAGLSMLLAVLAALAILRFMPAGTEAKPPTYKPRYPVNTSGATIFSQFIEPWGPNASLEEIGSGFRQGLLRSLSDIDRQLEEGIQHFTLMMLTKASLLHNQGDPRGAYKVLEELRTRIKGKTALEEEDLFTIIYYQGVTGLRIGESENCVMCRGVSACILPIVPEAVHINPEGSRLAVQHFSEYLHQFPDDLEVKWLLNLAHMTLGQHPDKVDPRYLLSLDAFRKCECDIGVFRDISHLVGLDRLNQSGGAIMEDFDNDGLLDLVVTNWDPNGPMAYYRNKGDGTFEDRTKAAGLDKQRSGLYCVQADYNNDGHMDIFIPRGAWQRFELAMRPSLLRNNGDGTFTDVTREAGLLQAVNSISACWADFDNDGHIDLFICCEQQPNLLYRNKGDGTFEEVALRAGVQGTGNCCKGGTWIDFDNDGYPDLFLNYLGGTAQLFRNNRDGTFTDVTKKMGIDGPERGFSCWAFDFDNDGWLDIFATSYSHTVADVVKGLLNQPHEQPSSRLYRNLQGMGFQDVTKETGLDKVYATMGSNFGDFDNDGYLDFYLGTGETSYGALFPNRLFKNVAGKRFTEITASSRTGHLQKGHGVACGDWDRNGTVDIFIQTGGAVEGDRYHNVLFQNPGQQNSWLNVKLVGKKTNRAAIGARIKVVTAGARPLTVHRHVSSGSSFGANPLEQHIGLGKAERVALLEIHWPTSGTAQVFRDLAINQGVVVTEFASDYQKRTWKPIELPR